MQSQNAQLIEQLTESNNKLQSQIAPLIENNKALESSNRQLRESFKTLELINSEFQESLNELTKDYERLKGHYTNLEKRNSRLREKYWNDVQSKLEELPGIKKENELFKKYIAWYRDTYETRSILGVLKTKLESKFKKKSDSASTENPSSKTASENNSINPIGKSRYAGRLNVRYKADTSHLSKACIFSSFSFSGEVEEYVFYYLDELKKAGFSTVFVSTSILPKRSVQRLSQYVCLIIERDNICPDFGSWKAGLSLLDWDKLDAVVLTNDSVFGPLFNLDDIILSMNDGYDVWGISDNYEGLHFSWNPSRTDHHLQSYCCSSVSGASGPRAPPTGRPRRSRRRSSGWAVGHPDLDSSRRRSRRPVRHSLSSAGTTRRSRWPRPTPRKASSSTMSSSSAWRPAASRAPGRSARRTIPSARTRRSAASPTSRGHALAAR